MAKTADYNIGPHTFPRGWFMIGISNEVTDQPQGVRYFGHDFALYRGKKSGKVILLDAYCPHMGTHLAKNKSSYTARDGHVVDDDIQCPYHAWRFGADGRCNHIPYYNGAIPKAASVKSWPVREHAGLIFMWHDPEGGEPDFDLPVLSEYGQPHWVPWNVDKLGVMASHPQEVIDNIADLPHLGPIHGSTVEYFENEFRGHKAIQRQAGGHRTLVAGPNDKLYTDTVYHGPGILVSHLTGLFDTVLLITHTPVDDGVIEVWHALLVKTQNAVPTDADREAARGFNESSRLAFLQDFEVWGNKRAAINILQIPTDGPFHKARIWYKQFYHPRSEAKRIIGPIEGVHVVPGTPGWPLDRVS
jgi:3-ketosteroid 9alpha-monooxygenase subunit A